MGRKIKSETWLPADSIRVKAFSREFAARVLNVPVMHSPKANDIQNALSHRQDSLTVSDTTLRKWINGEDQPNATYLKWIERVWPGSADWLVPDVEVSPIHRFLCALDVWGSPIDSPSRKLETSSKVINIGKVVRILAKRWAPKVINDGRGGHSGFAIPRLKCKVPQQVPLDTYRSINPLTLMDFMFMSGPYLQLGEEDFSEWAIDLASLTLLIAAFYEGTPLVDRFQLGKTGDYCGLLDSFFFHPHGKWPNLDALSGRLEEFPEFYDSLSSYSQRLMDAREVLRKELLSIGTDLLIVKKLTELTKDVDKMWQECIDLSDESFDENDLIREQKVLTPTAPERYRYELRVLTDGSRVVLCHDFEIGTYAPLVKRPDLYKGYAGDFSWGYSGDGPTLLAISLLAHHFGHTNFGPKETDQLLRAYISKFSERLSGAFFLTTGLIENCLNE